MLLTTWMMMSVVMLAGILRIRRMQRASFLMRPSTMRSRTWSVASAATLSSPFAVQLCLAQAWSPPARRQHQGRRTCLDMRVCRLAGRASQQCAMRFWRGHSIAQRPVLPRMRLWSGWTGSSLAIGSLVVKGVFCVFASCCWMLALGDSAGIGRSAGAADVPQAAHAAIAMSLAALLWLASPGCLACVLATMASAPATDVYLGRP